MEDQTRQREFKTSPEQWKVIVGYLEEYPNLLKNKFQSSDGDYENHQKLWENLATHLNSMGLGIRTVSKWQAAVGRWKSKTKAKASAIRLDSQKTGGGPASVPPLNTTEERLMNLLGYKSITGDMNKELGFSADTILPMAHSSSQPATVVETVDEASGSHQQESDEILPPLVSLTTKVQKRCSEKTTTDAPPRKKIRTAGEKTRRFVNMTRMHSELMDKLSSIDNNVGTMASALVQMSDAVTAYLQHKMDEH